MPLPHKTRAFILGGGAFQGIFQQVLRLLNQPAKIVARAAPRAKMLKHSIGINHEGEDGRVSQAGMNEGVRHAFAIGGVYKNRRGVEVSLNFAIRDGCKKLDIGHRFRPVAHLFPQHFVLHRANHPALRLGQAFGKIEKKVGAFHAMAARHPEQINGFVCPLVKFWLLQKQARHRAGHAFFPEEACLMFGNPKPRVRQMQAALKKKPANRIVAAKAAINFRVQCADKNQTEPVKDADLAKQVKPRRPAIHHDEIRPLFAKDAGNGREGGQAIGQPTGIEAFPDADCDVFPNDPVRLARIRRKDCCLMSARYQFACQKCHLQLGAARGTLGGRIKREVRVAREEKKFHIPPLIFPNSHRLNQRTLVTLKRFCRVSRHHIARRDIVQDDGTRADHRAIANRNRAEDHHIAPHLHIVAQHRSRAIFFPEGGAMPQGTIFPNHRLLMHDQPHAVIKPQTGSDTGFEIQFDAQPPFDQHDINGRHRKPQPAQRLQFTQQLLRGAVKQQRALAFPIAAVGFPVLQDGIFHLACGSFMEVHFYLPGKYLPDSARQEAWKAGKVSTLEQGGKIACAQSWIYQTWAALTQAGLAVNLTQEIPSAGILVALTGFFSDEFRPPVDVFFAGIAADYLPHPGSHLHILQNPAHAKRLAHSAYMPHWPHPNLLPRDPARGDRFETVCFFGDESNLAAELRDKSWTSRLNDLGLRLEIRHADRWHDYRDADCVIAIRGFGRSPYLHKPATKLYNAWLAGVPFIGGLDSAYAGDGRAGVNFLQAASPDDLLGQLRRLQTEVSLREQLVEAGRETSRQFNSSAILERWRNLLTLEIPALAGHWKARGPLSRRAFMSGQSVRVWLDRKLRR